MTKTCHYSRTQCLAWDALLRCISCQDLPPLEPFSMFRKWHLGQQGGSLCRYSKTVSGVYAEMCSQFLTPSDCKPSDNWLTVLGLWETRAARKLKFSLQKEKTQHSWEKVLAMSERESWKQQYYRKATVDHSYIWITSVLQRSWHSAAIPYRNTHPSSVGRAPQGATAPGEWSSSCAGHGWTDWERVKWTQGKIRRHLG